MSYILSKGLLVTSSFSPLKAVIFDCDGVLVDSEPLHYQAFQEVLRPLGLGFDYDLYLEHYIGFDDRDAFAEALREAKRPIDPEMLTRLIQAKSEAFRRIVSGGISPFPGVVQLVRELASHRVPLAVGSGALGHEVRMFLDALELADAFSLIIAADDVEHSKPDPETYLKAMKGLQKMMGWENPDPRTCIVIEDTSTGIQSAKSAGLYVVGVTHSFPASSLKEADHIVETLTELSLSDLVRLIQG